MTAATHGFDEEAETLKQQLDAADQTVPSTNPSAVLLQPPPPIAQSESNWPLLTVSKGFFDGAMAARTIASGTAAVIEDESGVAEGWGEDADLGLDDEERPVAVSANDGSGYEEGGWEVGDDDLELPADLNTSAPGADDEDKGYYVPPTRGQPPSHSWVAHSQLAIDHATAGSFETAFRLLHDQIGVINFEPFK